MEFHAGSRRHDVSLGLRRGGEGGPQERELAAVEGYDAYFGGGDSEGEEREGEMCYEARFEGVEDAGAGGGF